MNFTPRPTPLPPSPTTVPAFSFVATVIKHWPTPNVEQTKAKASASNRYEEVYKQPIDKPIIGPALLKPSWKPSPSPSPPPMVTVAVAVAVPERTGTNDNGSSSRSGRKSPRQGGRETPPKAFHHRLLQVPSPAVNGTESAPIGPLSPAVIGMNLTTTALPTTHLTLHAPDFDMQLPPVNRSSHSRSPPPSSLASSPSRPLPSQSTSTTGPSSSSKGQIHVKLISARGLNAHSINSRPYAVVVFENNEFISRDPTDEGDKEVRGIATNLSRTSSSIAVSALGAFGSKAAVQDTPTLTRRQSPVSSSSSNSAKSSLSIPGGSGSRTPAVRLLGRTSAQNPVWKHEVSLYVNFLSSLGLADDVFSLPLLTAT
jgi:serine/threonine protein kinase SCH9